MREALAGLTTRGRCFVYAGLACAGSGLALGRRDFVAIGLFLVVLALVSTATVYRTRYRLACWRVIDPARVEAGRPGRVVLRLHNISRLPTGVLLVEDTLPYALGARPRFVLNRLEPQGVREVSYTLRSDVRGRYTIGPLTVRLADPLGLCELARSFSATDTLVVTPPVWALPSVRLGGGWSGNGESRTRSVAASGEDDVATREYRHGDDLRRIHWRSTARTGDLMVRREEQPWQTSALLVLDNRAHAHRGDGPGSSFEYACSAVASIGLQLLRANFTVRMGTGFSQHHVPQVDVDENLLLDQLAVAPLARSTMLADPSAPLGIGGLVVAVLGSLSIEEAETLSRSHHGTGTRIAVALDTASWTVLSSRVRGETAAAYDASTRVLEATGWRVLRIAQGTSLGAVWREAGLSRLAVAQGAGTDPMGGSA